MTTVEMTCRLLQDAHKQILDLCGACTVVGLEQMGKELLAIDRKVATAVADLRTDEARRAGGGK